MSPGKVRAAVVSDKAELIARMLDGVGTLPLASEQEFLADPRMVAVMADYRNRLVHFYDEVTPAALYRILTAHIDDIRRLTSGLRAWLVAHPDQVDESL